MEISDQMLLNHTRYITEIKNLCWKVKLLIPIIKRQNNKLYDSLIKSKLGNGSWFNEQIETNYLSAFADETGIKDASLRSSYLNKAHIDALPTNIRKTVYAALDFLMENIKKVR